jgi:hypothetical protein
MKSPLLKKRALDALLDSMMTDDYQSLGGHGVDKGNKPYASPIGGTGGSKGTEFENKGDRNSGEINVVIPPKDLAPPSGPEDAEFFKESEPKVGTRYHRRPANRRHLNTYIQIAEAHPDWSEAQVEAQATLVSLGVKPIENVLREVQGEEKEAREIVPVEEDKAEHEFYKHAPVVKKAHGQFPDSGQYDFEHEDHVRREAKQWSQYAEPADNVNTDNIKSFDPEGNYLCGTCDMRQGTDECMRVNGPISFEKGSCRLYHRGSPENQMPMEKKFSRAEAKYAEHEGGFGCHRCEYGTEAEAPDQHGRKSWCAFWGMHIVPLACCAEWDEGDKPHKDASLVTIAELARTAAGAGRTLYHVTFTDKVPSIRQKGILPLQASNWIKGSPEGERYGEGEIYAIDNPADAVRWASKMDWEFNKGMGTGKISIIAFKFGTEQWKVDTSDPISQAANAGRWLKAVGSVKPEQIVSVHALEPEMVKAVIQNREVKLGGKPKCPHCGSDDYGLMPADFETAKCNSCGKNWGHGIVPGINDPCKKTADVPTKSYGMGTPIGGTDNPDAGASDEEELDEGEAMLNMTSSEENEYDSQARLWASEVDGNDLAVAMGKIGSTDNCGWFAKSARPTEQKIELLQKQFRLTPEQIEFCIQADPSPNQTDFVATIAKWLGRNLIKLPEDAPKLKQQLDLFNKLKKSPKFQGNKDIQSYMPESLYETVKQNQEAVSKKEKVRQDVAKGSEIIVKDGDLTIYKVIDAAALMELSGGTNWCTAHNKWSKQYLSEGPSYVFFKGGSAFAQLHPASDQLMNRTDVCMVQEIEDEGQTIAKFVDDPTALRGLQLLSAKAPDVAAWVKENATDPATLVEILGKKKEEESAKGTKTRTMAVQYALAKGEPLSPEEEQHLGKQVELPLLMRYGAKFHAGQRWAPLEKAVLSAKDREQEITDYALEFVRGRWAAGEKKILQKAFPTKSSEKYGVRSMMSQAVDYALRVIKGRWPEFEAKLHKAQPNFETAFGSAKYAVEVLKRAWRDTPGIEPMPDGTFHEEALIASDAKNEHFYAKTFFPSEMWEQFMERIAPESGLDKRNFRPEQDLWIVREWDDLEECVSQIGNEGANDALYYALRSEGTRPTPEMPDDREMADELVKALSYDAMRRIGQSLQQEEEGVLQWWAQEQKAGRVTSSREVQQIDFTDENQMRSILLTMARYAPDCSVWKNIHEAYRLSGEARYADDRTSDLHYELTDGMRERNDNVYTELRYGPKFDESFGYEWRIAPVYEVLDRWGASRMLSDGPKDISDGQLELWVDPNPDYSDRDEEYEAPELMEKWYTEGGSPQQKTDKNQMRFQFQSFLLKKKALIEMHETSDKLPPRDDMKEHLDQQEQDLLTKGVMQGVHEPLNPKKKRIPMIDPRINPDGVVAAIEVKQPSHHCPVCGGPNYYKKSEGCRPFCSKECASKGTRPKTAARSKQELEKLALDQFGIGSVDNERIYVLRNGTILNCDDMDHFTVENFYTDEEYEDEEAIVAFLKDTGALRVGLHDGVLFYHLPPKGLTPQQIAQATAFAANWEPSVTDKWIFYFPPDLDAKELPEWSRPADIRRMLEGKGKIASLLGEAKEFLFVTPDNPSKRFMTLVEKATGRNAPRLLELCKQVVTAYKLYKAKEKETPWSWAKGYQENKFERRRTPEWQSFLKARTALRDHVNKLPAAEVRITPKVDEREVPMSLTPYSINLNPSHRRPSMEEQEERMASKTAEYAQQDTERGEEAQYFLEQEQDAEDEVKRHFMQEGYIKQLAEENSKTMDEMWDMAGEEYTAEFYGYPYKRVHDFTDEEVPDEEVPSEERHKSSAAENPLFGEIDAAWGKSERPDDEVVQRIGTVAGKTNLPSH